MGNRILPMIASAVIAVTGTAAQAQSNVGPPANPVYGLTGQAQTLVYTNYSFSFVAQFALTNLTFAMRDDPYFIQLDDISMSTGAGANLLVNPGFESGPSGAAAPAGWTYLNQYGAAAGGVVTSGCGRTGTFCYFDGAVQAYDAITQAVTTTIGATYNVSFWARVNTIGGTGLYQPLSTNGVITGTGGNGIDLFVYAGQGAPAAGNVPEPATWGMMIVGLGLAGTALRRSRASRAPAAA